MDEHAVSEARQHTSNWQCFSLKVRACAKLIGQDFSISVCFLFHSRPVWSNCVVLSICLLMVALSVGLSIPPSLSASIEPLINFSSALGISDILICKQQWLNPWKAGYQISSGIWQYFMPIAVVVREEDKQFLRRSNQA